MIGYGILLALAMALNMRDVRMTALSGVVGIGIFIPIADAYFYLICAAVEFGVALAALRINAAASRAVVRISMLLVLFHVLGWWLDGYPPASPYHAMVKICEHAELVACAVLSRPITRMVSYV